MRTCKPIWLLALALVLLHPAAPAFAGPLALPPPPGAALVPQLGARLPLDLAFSDERGVSGPLGRYFDRRPVVLVLGYYQCPNLCGTLMEGVLHALAHTGLPADAWRVVEVSIDPEETPQIAARKKASYGWMPGASNASAPGADRLHLLTGSAEPIARLARAVGFHYSDDRGARQFAHPATFMIVTPEGRIARYFPDMRADARAMRLALVEAAAGRIGTLGDRLVLLCSHYDPATGRYSVTAMALVRIACLLTLGVLAGWIALRELAGRRKRGA